MINIAGLLDGQIRAAGVDIVGVSVKDDTDKSTWTVQPTNLQSAAQPTIDAFDISAEILIQKWIELRAARTALLFNCDWTQLADSPLSEASQLSWQTYRQALRDLPATTVDPANPTWPTPPA